MINMNILGKPTATLEQCKLWIKGIKTANKLAVDNIETLYKAAENNGINPVILIAQAMVETGYFNFGGVINASYHNTCGLKITKGGGDKAASAHMKFKSWKEGIQAHADHLALYAGAKKFPKYSPNCAADLNTEYKSNGTTQDPRHFSYLYGKCKTVESLDGNWATGKDYSNKILKLVNQIHNTKENSTATKTQAKFKNGTYNKPAKVTASKLNIRKGRPGTTGYDVIIGQYTKGQKIEVRYCLGNWFGVIYNNQQGFVCGDYIELI